MTNQPKPAPTAEEQLPERISEIESRIAAITKGPWELRRGFSDWGMACQHDIVVGEDHIAGIPSVTPHCIGERSKVKDEAAHQWGVAQFIAAAPEDIRFLLDSLTAALRSNRDSLARIEKLDDQLDEKDAKIAELEADRDEWKVQHGVTFAFYEDEVRQEESMRHRAEAAEAKLRAVSEAAKEKIKPRFKHWVTPDGPVHECYLASEVDSLLSRIGKLAE